MDQEKHTGTQVWGQARIIIYKYGFKQSNKNTGVWTSKYKVIQVWCGATETKKYTNGARIAYTNTSNTQVNR